MELAHAQQHVDEVYEIVVVYYCLWMYTQRERVKEAQTVTLSSPKH